jgi:hypothetical protein
MTLQISFRDRPIHKAPLEVLQHLYYYTTQYGLSVAQFTGAHQKYWESLPKRLREATQSDRELKSIVIELEKYAEGAEERLAKRREQKDKKWAEKEIILNAQLISVLAAYPFELLSLGFKGLIGDNDFPNSLRIVDLVFQKEDGNDAFCFVEPDILLLGDNHLLMVELKTRGSSRSSRNYPASQLLNYFRLIIECQDSQDNKLPTEFSHLIIVPSTDAKWIERYTEWVITTRDNSGKFIVQPDGCIKAGRGNSSLNFERMKDLLLKLPIYYRSWEELEESFKVAISQFKDERNHHHWERLCEELTVLSSTAGKYK